MQPTPQPEFVDDFTLEAAGHYSHLAAIRQTVLDLCARAGCAQEKASQLEMAVDEACTNIIEHSYGPGKSQLAQATPDAIRIHFHHTAGRIVVEIFDRGDGFDFSGTPDVPPASYLDERRQRGLGMYIIRCFVDGADYQRATPLGNCLRLTKLF